MTFFAILKLFAHHPVKLERYISNNTEVVIVLVGKRDDVVVAISNLNVIKFCEFVGSSFFTRSGTFEVTITP